MNMFALLINNAIPGANNAWTYWIEHIMKQKDTLGIRRAAMASKQGFMSASTPRFILSGQEIQALNRLFKKKDEEKISIDDRTYVIRRMDDRHLLAFNGAKFLIICPSKSMYILIESEGRKDKLDEAVAFTKGLCNKLSAKNY